MSRGPAFAGLRYSRVWEDHDVLTRALEVDSDDDVLSICSGGCNVLALALTGARSVTAVDVNPTQLALLALHLAAVHALSHRERLALLGVTASGPRARLALYERVREHLDAPHVRFWDGHADLLEGGPVHAGRFDRHVAAFRLRLGPRTRALLDDLARCRTLTEQRAVVRRLEGDDEFRRTFEDHYGTAGLAAGGRAQDQYDHVEIEDTGAWFRERALHDLRNRLVSTNMYATLFWVGAYPEDRYMPTHLSERGHERLRRCASRVRLREGRVEDVVAQAATGTYSKVNMSDVFEYHSEPDTRASLTLLGERVRPGGRVAWWSLLVPRPLPDGTVGLVARDDVSGPLHERCDRVFFYRSFHVAEVAEGGGRAG